MKKFQGARQSFGLFMAGVLVLLAVSVLAPSGAGAADGGNFTETDSMADSRAGFTATALPDGRVLVTGGMDLGLNVLDTAELFDPATGNFSPTTGAMTTPRWNHTATALPGGKVLIAGGMSADAGPALSTAEIFDPATGTFTATSGPMDEVREYHASALMSNGKVLVTGGEDELGNLTNEAEIFNPVTGQFSATASSMLDERHSHTATALGSGVLVFGGSGPAPLDSTEAFIGVSFPTSAFLDGPDMSVGRTGHTATVLPAGANSATSRILVAGGAGQSNATAELFSVSSILDFGPPITMTAARNFHTATRLPDGRVLLAGGQVPPSDSLSSAEIYDPGSNAFTTTDSMDAGRNSHVAAPLPGGRVLVAGGLDEGFPTATAEIFTPDETLTVTRSGTGTGTVTSSPAGIDCGSVCTAVFPSDLETTVTLTAAPDSGSTFTGWEGDCSGMGPCEVSMLVGHSVTANFVKEAVIVDCFPPKVGIPPDCVDPPTETEGKLGKLTVTRKAKVKAGRKVKIKVTVSNTGGKSLTAKVNLKSSSKRVKVPKSVKITAAAGKSASKSVTIKAGKKAKGKATITAKSGGKTAKSKVTVQPAG